MKYRLFYKNGCGSCKAVKSQLDAKGVDYELIDVGTQEGWDIAKSLDIRFSGAIVDETGNLVKLKDI